MKKLLCLLLAVALFATLCGCDVIDELSDKLFPDKSDTWKPNTGNLSTLPTVNWFTPIGGNNATQDTAGMPDATLTPSQTLPPQPTTLVMPQFENTTLAYATSWLETVGISTTVLYVHSDTVQENYIISQSIPAGTDITPGQALTLTVSSGAEVCPYDYSQKLTVTAPAGSSNATVTLYEWKNGGWEAIVSYNACVGSNGIGTAAEGSRRTPMGIFELGVVLTSVTVNTNFPVHTVTSSTCVVDDTNSPYYNMILEQYQVPVGTSVDTIGKGLTNGNTYATIYIEHNGNGFSSEGVVRGRGSAIGLRGQYGDLKATYGDVDISLRDMKDLLSRLDANKNPVIEITLQ